MWPVIVGDTKSSAATVMIKKKKKTPIIKNKKKTPIIKNKSPISIRGINKKIRIVHYAFKVSDSPKFFFTSYYKSFTFGKIKV
jgi:hypothetical protein